MRLKTPHFWYETDKTDARLKGAALSPFSFCYGLGYSLHQIIARPYKTAIPVLCVGNLVAGGSGKTPSALAVMDLIQKNKLFERPVFLSRGYGGSLKGPVEVKEDQHSAEETGDEPLLLSRLAPTIISGNRQKGAVFAEKINADLIIMDDGLQNTSLEKTLNIIVIDGTYGFGNRRILPAGPLREPLKAGLEKADGFILIGNDQKNIRLLLPQDKPVFEASLQIPESWIYDRDLPYIAFSGIAQPQKFYNTLRDKGLNIIATHNFPDHYVYEEQELAKLSEEAEQKNARLITTEKDSVRIPPDFKAKVPLDILPVQMVWNDPESLGEFLKGRLK